MLTVWRKNSMKPRTNLRLNSKGALCTSIRGWLIFKQQLSLQAAACWAEAHFLFPPGHMDLTCKIRISLSCLIVELNQNISQLQWNKIVLSGALKLLSNPYFRTKWPAEVVKPAAGLLLNDARGFDCRSNFQVDLIDCVCLSLLDHF